MKRWLLDKKVKLIRSYAIKCLCKPKILFSLIIINNNIIHNIIHNNNNISLLHIANTL